MKTSLRKVSLFHLFTLLTLPYESTFFVCGLNAVCMHTMHVGKCKYICLKLP